MIPKINAVVLKAARNSIRNATLNNACEIERGFAQGFDKGFEAGVDFILEYCRQLDAEAAVAPAEMPKSEMTRAEMYRPKTKMSDDGAILDLDRKSLI